MNAQRPQILVCAKCGSTDVGRDASATWDVATQDFILGHVHDESWCDNCDCGDCGLNERAATPVEIAHSELFSPAVRQKALVAALHDLEHIFDGQEDCDDGTPNDAMKAMTIIRDARAKAGIA
jgi:hypothetical protein